MYVICISAFMYGLTLFTLTSSYSLCNAMFIIYVACMDMVLDSPRYNMQCFFKSLT